MKKFRICALLSIIIFYTIPVIGQKIIFDLNVYPTIDKDYNPSIILPYNGLGLSLNHGQNRLFQAGISFRSLPWGSEISLSEGYTIHIIDEPKYAINNISKIYLGVPLLYDKLSISSAFSSAFDFRLKRWERIYLSAGLRYNLNPSYFKISTKSRFLEGQIGLHVVLWK